MPVRRSLVLASVVILGLAFAAGCAEVASPVVTGIEIPLIQPGAGDTVYRLTATFEIRRPDGTFLTVDGGGPDAAVTVELDPGFHQLRVMDGWTLERSLDAGTTFAAVDAILGSPNPTFVRVIPNLIVNPRLQFLVREATGSIAISFGVVDPPAQLSGDVRFVEAPDPAYAAYVNTAVDMEIWFTTNGQQISVDQDGTCGRLYDSFINALQLFNDGPGQLAALSTDFSGGFLTFTTRSHPDGVQDFSGEYFANRGSFAEFRFGLSARAALTVDQNNCPADDFFFADGSTVEIVVDTVVVLRATLNSLLYFPGALTSTN